MCKSKVSYCEIIMFMLMLNTTDGVVLWFLIIFQKTACIVKIVKKEEKR